MEGLSGPYASWLGLVDAFGIGLALLVWYAVRGAGERRRAVAVAAGGLLLVLVLATVVGRAYTIGTGIALIGFREDGGRRVFDVLLALAGLAAGIGVVRYVHRRAEEPVRLAAEPVDDAEPLDDEPVVHPARWTAAALWADAVAVVLAVALPISASSNFDSIDLTRHGDISVLTVCFHLLAGLGLAGALFAVLRPDELTDARVVTGAFALVAVGAVLLFAWPRGLTNEFWATGASGLAIGLVLPTAPRFLAAAFPADRTVLLTGVLVALALLTVRAVTYGRALSDYFGTYESGPFVDQGPIDPGDDGSIVVVPSGPLPTFIVPTFEVPTFEFTAPPAP